MKRWLIPALLVCFLATVSEAGEYKLGPRDVLSVSVYTGGSPTGSAPAGGSTAEGKLPYVEYVVVVNSGGTISLPLVGKTKAQGLSVDELEETLGEELKKFYREPQVWVSVKEYLSRRVYVLGQVKQNGPVSLDRDHVTLFEVISMAGGFVEPQFLTEGADRRNIIVTRGERKIVVNLHASLTDLSKVRDFVVEPGDKVFVPKPIKRVQVMGGVKSAGEFELTEGMTLLRAIALAGSFTEKSRRDLTYVIRKEGAGKTNTRYDCTKIVVGKAEDPALASGDIVYVAEW